MTDNETTADVIAAMRDEAARADMEQECSIDDAASAAKMMREFARRFEAAHKREMRDAVTNCNQFGNAAKLREALKKIRNDVLDMVVNHKSDDPSYAYGLCISIGRDCDMALNSTKEFEEGGEK